MRFHSFLLACCSVCPIGLMAQYGSLFGEETTAWTIREISLPGEYSDSLVTTGDTVVDGLLYHRLVEYSSLEPGSLTECIRFVREDTVNGLAWTFTLIDPEPKLVMDLTLQVGDQFDLHSMGSMEVILSWSRESGQEVGLG